MVSVFFKSSGEIIRYISLSSTILLKLSAYILILYFFKIITFYPTINIWIGVLSYIDPFSSIKAINMSSPLTSWIDDTSEQCISNYIPVVYYSEVHFLCFGTLNDRL